jgi:hypothetical protein
MLYRSTSIGKGETSYFRKVSGRNEGAFWRPITMTDDLYHCYLVISPSGAGVIAICPTLEKAQEIRNRYFKSARIYNQYGYVYIPSPDNLAKNIVNESHSEQHNMHPDNAGTIDTDNVPSG